MLRLSIFCFFILQTTQAQVCDPDPCVNGKCSESSIVDKLYKCTCDDGWAGIHCDLPKPTVTCGNKTIEIFIDSRIVTEQGLPPDVEFVHFFNSPKCSAENRGGGYHLKVAAPFKDCGVIITHNGNDYTFYQQIVWNRIGNAVERPWVLLDFKCNYKDKYTVSNGEIVPYETAVDFKTSYGTFKVDMSLYRSPDFEDDNRYGARPVVQVEDDVCVSTELKNVMPQDLVLTNRECWASTNKDGSGETHYLVTEKCKDDPTTNILSNGVGNFSRFCFQMFRWRDSMDEVYVNCIVNVCNATAGEEYCQCESSRKKRFARTPGENGAKITFGPLYVRTVQETEDQLPDINDHLFLYPDENDNSEKGADSKTFILVIVGVIVLLALVILAAVIGVYMKYRRRSREEKSTMRSEGEPVVIPNPATDLAMLH